MVVSILHKLKDYEIAGYTDIEDRGPLLGVPYIGPDAKLTGFLAGKTACRAILAVGQVGRGDMRQKIHSRLFELQLEFPAIISPHATVNEAVIVNRRNCRDGWSRDQQRRSNWFRRNSQHQ